MDPMKRLSAFLYGFTPTSALVCSADGDPPVEGGGQAPQQPPPAPATPAGPPQFTPEQQAWIQQETERKANAAAAAARRAEQERLGRRGGEAPPQQPPQPAPAAQQPQAHADPAAVYQRLRTFDRAVDRFDVSDDARGILEADFNAANPQDPAAWVAQRATAFGLRPRGQAATPNPNTPPAAVPNGQPAAPPPAQPPGSPPARVITADTPIWQLSREDQQRLSRQLGPFEFKKRLLGQLAESGQRFSLRR